SINNAPADVIIAAVFGIVGYWLVKHEFEPAPMILGFVLGPLMEENLRRAMLIARGDVTVFLTRPISGALLATAAFLLIIAALPMMRKRRDEVFVEKPASRPAPKPPRFDGIPSRAIAARLISIHMGRRILRREWVSSRRVAPPHSRSCANTSI